jgi:hypothetical protein
VRKINGYIGLDRLLGPWYMLLFIILLLRIIGNGPWSILLMADFEAEYT